MKIYVLSALLVVYAFMPNSAFAKGMSGTVMSQVQCVNGVTVNGKLAPFILMQTERPDGYFLIPTRDILRRDIQLPFVGDTITNISTKESAEDYFCVKSVLPLVVQKAQLLLSYTNAEGVTVQVAAGTYDPAVLMRERGVDDIVRAAPVATPTQTVRPHYTPSLADTGVARDVSVDRSLGEYVWVQRFAVGPYTWWCRERVAKQPECAVFVSNSTGRQRSLGVQVSHGYTNQKIIASPRGSYVAINTNTFTRVYDAKTLRIVKTVRPPVGTRFGYDDEYLRYMPDVLWKSDSELTLGVYKAGLYATFDEEGNIVPPEPEKYIAIRVK